MEQVRGTGEELPESVVETLRQALKFAQLRNFEEAIPILESVKDAAPVPAGFNNLGAAYLAIGNQERAKQYFEEALAGNQDEPTARSNLSRISPGPVAEECCTIVSNPELLGVSGRVVTLLREFQAFM